MSDVRAWIEAGFERFARILYHHRIKTLILLLTAVAALASQIPHIKMDLSTEGLLHKSDPALLAYNQFRDQFGRDEVIIIAINPSDVFSPVFLEKLRRFHSELEATVPYLEDITSLINARNTRGEATELIVEDLLEKWPETPAQLNDVKSRAMANRMYRNMLLSEDGTFTTVIIQTQSHSSEGQETDIMGGFETDDLEIADEPPSTPSDRRYLTDTENSEAVMAVERVIRRYEGADFPVYLAGSPVMSHFIKLSLMRDTRTFLVLCVITIAVFLFLMFRRLSGVVLPLFIVLLSLVSTVGIMAICEVPVKLPTQILPSFLLAVCVGASVHILAVFYHHFRRHRDKESAIAYAMGHSGLAVVMTHLTTASGLLSFATADIAPIADLGIFSAVGVLIGLIFTLVLLPAMLAIVPIKPVAPPETTHHSTAMDRFLSAVGDFAVARRRAILACSVLVMAIAVISASTVRFSHSPLAWFPNDAAIRTSTATIDTEMRGSLSLEVVIDTGQENGLYNPDLLNRMEQAAEWVENLEMAEIFCGKAWSLTTILKEIHQALNENRAEYYAVPGNRELIAQELLLFQNSGSDDLEDFTDSQFSKARFTIKVPFKDAIKYGSFLKVVTRHFEANFPEARITMTGMMALLFRTISNVIISMAKSYAIALSVITLLMILLIGRVRIGLLSMVPNLTPILIMLGLMGAMSIPMDLFTLMVASIAIGLAVDDTIHFMHNFRRYYEQTGDPVTAVHETLQTTGRAMLVTSIVLSLGFFIYIFATMKSVAQFGVLTGITILMALLADYLIAPALMVTVNRPKESAVSSSEFRVPSTRSCKAE